MLAIAAHSFNSPSETFIRDHVRMIAPGKTILLCNDGRGAEQFGYPVLALMDSRSPPRSPLQRMANAFEHRWRKYVNPSLRLADKNRVIAFLNAYKPSALLAEYGPMGCLLSRACQEARVPLYVHFHGYDANVLTTSRAIVRQYGRLFRDAEGIIATTNFLKSRLASLGYEIQNLHVCPCGVDPLRFSADYRSSKDKIIVMVSRLIPQKGPLLSLASFSLVLQRHPDAILEIIGDGPLRGELEYMIDKLAIRDRIRIHGAKSHEFVASRLQEARMLIQHCVTLPGGGVESLGLSLLEAMASGIPVVATRHGAIVETVEDGVNGLLVQEYDTKGMAAAINVLLDNSDRAVAMGRSGRQRILERYTAERSRDHLRAIMGLPQSIAAESRSIGNDREYADFEHLGAEDI